MATVDAEKKLQKRVLHWLVDDLGYTYLGNLEDIDNTPVKEDLLKANLKKRGYSDDQIKTAISELLSKVNNQVDTLYQINRGVYSLLRYGRQGAKDERGRRQTVHYINWDDIDSNDFYVAEEVSVLRFDKVTRKRPDVVLYINGIALGIFELKSSYVSAGKGIRQMLQNQKRENILNFFSTAQFLFAGNEAEGLFYGTTDTPEKYYLKWKEDKKATDELSAAVKLLQVKEVNRLRDGVISLCHKERFLSLIHDFVIYDAGIKKVTRHNQYFANIAARKRIQDKEGGIIWNTQGSGKSLIMVWLTKWIIENVTDSRVVIITDRDELDDQIESLFIDVDEKVRRAKSCADLRSILDKNEDAMEYTSNEKQILSLMERTDFRNLSKNDVLSYASKLNELRPEVAQQVIAQFPELAKLIQSTMAEYKDILEKIVASDDESTNQVYGIISKEVDNASDSRKEFIEYADKVRADLSKCLDNPNLTPEQQKDILDRQMEIFNAVDKKDTEIREHEMEMARMADKKDTEKKEFNWKVLGAASFVVLTAVGIGTAALGGKFDFKLPKKS